MTPEQIALDALAQLGEDPEPDPIAQLHAIAGQATHATAQINPASLIPPGPLDDAPEALAAIQQYERTLDRATIALVAAARIDRTQGPRDFLDTAARALETDPTGKATP